MSGSNTSFHSKIYNNFKEIDKYAHKEIVKFYATHEVDIQRLKFHEYFDLQIAYIDALFEIGAYNHLLRICDETIEMVIQNNITYHHGDDVYRKLLLRKAATHYNLLEYLKAEFILKELIKIDIGIIAYTEEGLFRRYNDSMGNMGTLINEGIWGVTDILVYSDTSFLIGTKENIFHYLIIATGILES